MVNDIGLGYQKRPTRNSQPGSALGQMEPSRVAERTAQLLFRIVIPESELREIEVEKKLANVMWLDVPEPGSAKIIECYLTPPVEGAFDESHLPFARLFSFQLPIGNWFVALEKDEKVSEADEMQLVNVRTASLRMATETGIEIRPQFRRGLSQT